VKKTAGRIFRVVLPGESEEPGRVLASGSEVAVEEEVSGIAKDCISIIRGMRGVVEISGIVNSSVAKATFELADYVGAKAPTPNPANVR
jgi:hypothetical protein